MSTSVRLIRRGRRADGSAAPRIDRGMPGTVGGHAPASVATPTRHADAGLLPFALLALFIFILYTRPQDLMPVLRPFRLAFLFGVGAAAAHVTDALGRGAPVARPVREVFLLGALLGLGAASVPFSLWPGQSASILFDQLAKVALAFLLVSHLVDTPARVRSTERVLVAAGVYLAVGALTAFASGGLGHYDGRAGGIVGGMFKDPNDLALTLVIMIALAAFQAVASRRVVGTLLLAGAIVVMLAGILVTFSRGGLVALLAAAAVGVLRLSRHGRGVAVAGLVGLALAVAVLAPEGYGQRATSIVAQDKDTRGSIQARLTTLRYGIEIMLENPVPGVGLGAFAIAEGAKHGGVGKWNEAHNAFIQVGAELGWAGLAVYVALAACALANARAAARRAAGNPELTATAHGLETAVVGFLAGAMFLSQAYTWHFYILLGLTVAWRRLVETQLPPVTAEAGVERHRPAPAVLPSGSASRRGAGPPRLGGRAPKRAG